MASFLLLPVDQIWRSGAAPISLAILRYVHHLKNRTPM
jgi:hypothetical protein